MSFLYFGGDLMKASMNGKLNKDLTDSEREIRNAYQKEIYEKKKAKILARRKELYHAKHKKYKQDYYEQNKSSINEKTRVRANSYYAIDKQYSLKNKYRVLINQFLKYGSSSESLVKLTSSPSAKIFREHIELQLSPGMSYKNRGDWHIDHISPVKSFDLTKPSELKECYHYTNLEPVWRDMNLHKGGGEKNSKSNCVIKPNPGRLKELRQERLDLKFIFEKPKVELSNFILPKYLMDPQIKIEKRISSKINHALKHNILPSSIKELLSVSGLIDLKKHITSKFEEGMSWVDRSAWHIDHIIPVKDFDLTNESELLRCYHHTNLKPVWATANLEKGATSKEK